MQQHPHPQHGERPQLGPPPLRRPQQHILIGFLFLDDSTLNLFDFFLTRFADVLFLTLVTDIYTLDAPYAFIQKRNANLK